MHKVKKHNIMLRLKLKIFYGWICLNCFNDENLEFAHIKENGFNGMGRGGPNRYYNIKNNPKCYSLFCKKCHNEFDDRFI